MRLSPYLTQGSSSTSHFASTRPFHRGASKRSFSTSPPHHLPPKDKYRYNFNTSLSFSEEPDPDVCTTSNRIFAVLTVEYSMSTSDELRPPS